MRIALVDSNPKKSRYPYSLLKIGAWQKSLGNECELFLNDVPDKNKYDEIWISTTFTYDVPNALRLVEKAKLACDCVRVGGISATLMPDVFEQAGVIVHKGLVKEAECVVQDFSLLKKVPDYTIVFTGRGCPRKCKFCMVRILETETTHYTNWHKSVLPTSKTLMIWDNNWTAKPEHQRAQDIEAIKNLSQIKEVNFSQGWDCRIIDTDIEFAKSVSDMKVKLCRLAFDGMQSDGYYQRAVENLAKNAGFKRFASYMLYNFDNDMQNFYYRLKQNVILTHKLNVLCMSIPMRYQPIMSITKRNTHIGKGWSQETLYAFKIISQYTGWMYYIWFHRNKKLTPVEQFEFWFGKDEREFQQILEYDRIRELCKKKYGYALYNF